MTLTDLDLSQIINGLAGRSWFFDSVVSLAAANDLIKSAPIGACFFAAWYGAAAADRILQIRRALLVGLVATVLTVITTNCLTQLIYYPRPYLRSHQVYVLQGNQLKALPRLALRTPLDNRGQERLKAAAVGNVPPSDFNSFPSDHAAFFLCMALGILVARPKVGAIATAWTLLVIVPGKMIPAMHSTGDVLAGAAIACAWLVLCHAMTRTPLNRVLSAVLNWTERHSGATAAILFMGIFEVASTLDHVKLLLSAVGKHI